MANTGIILRQDTKSNLEVNLPQEAEIVFATDTNEIGSLSEGVIYWQTWDSTQISQPILSGRIPPDSSQGDDGDKYIEVNQNFEIIEYKKEVGTWRELHKGETSQTWLDNNLERYEKIYLGRFNEFDMEVGYIPTVYNDIATLEFLDYATGDGQILLDGSVDMINGYIPSLPEDVVTQTYMESGTAEVVVPDYDHFIVGGLWNDNGIPRISAGPQGHIRYFTNSPITFNTGVKSPVNGVIDIIGNDEVYPNSGSQDQVTKIEVLSYGNRTSFYRLAYGCTDMTEFVVSATDESKVTNFGFAWRYCTSLTSFPVLDVSQGTNFSYAWSGSSLTSFPSLNVSQGTDFSGAWFNCTALTSFPVLDVSQGTNFDNSWYNCTALPHCPGGNEIIIPIGATTLDMCYGI